MIVLNKKGDVNWFVVSMILAIVVLVMFLLIYSVFPWKDTIDREACHQSVILRATVTGDNIPLKDMVQLRCKVKLICITAKSSGAGDCSGLGKTYETMRLSATNKLDQEQQIRMFLAREMADCWSMFGEGKLQIFSRGWTLSTRTSRAIVCSKIEFGKSVLLGKDGEDKTEDDIKNITGFLNYMVMYKVPNKNISYMDYLRNTPEGQSALEMYGSMAPETLKSGLASSGVGSVDLTSLKSIFYMETTKNNAGKIFFSSGVVAVVTVLCPECIVGAGKLLIKSPTVGILVVGGVLGVIAQAGDWIQNVFTSGPLKNNAAVGGLFLIDYTGSGFSDFDIDSFENYS